MKTIATVCFVLLISQTIVLKFGSAIPVTAISIGNASSITGKVYNNLMRSNHIFMFDFIPELFGNKTSDQEQEIVGMIFVIHIFYNLSQSFPICFRIIR